MRVKRQGIRWASSLGIVFILGVGVGVGVGCGDEGTTSENSSQAGGNAASGAAPVLPAEDPISAAVPDEPTIPVVLTDEELIEAGRSAYNANCIACHSIDATKDGALGPAIAGSSLALLEARVLRSKYPEGYVPKRPTRVMVALPHLESRLVELEAYLNSLD